MMFRLFLALAIALPAPVMTGRATWYGAPYIGREMRNGETYTGQDMTCAVEGDKWTEFAGARLLVCLDTTIMHVPRRCVIVTVTDSGDTNEFREHGVVVDLSVAAFDALRPRGTAADNDGVLEVMVWAAP